MINPEDWLPADGLTLEPNAFRAASEQHQNLALTAGPGAGKTEMLAQRADFLLRTNTCPYPKRILAISFKVDASVNLKERVQNRCGDYLAARFDSYTFHGFAKRIIDKFRIVLTGDNQLDADYDIGERKVYLRQITFNDLIPLAIEILENSVIARNALRQTYSDVFLDEFQDCTSDQYKLLKVAFLESQVRLTAVGDTKQKIMGWAGALDGIFENFARDFHAKALNMYMNFRSKPKLLRMQNKIIYDLDPSAALDINSIVGAEGCIESYTFNEVESETDFIIKKAMHWMENGIPYKEIAILVAQQPHLYCQNLMLKLAENEIPFKNEQELQDIANEPLAKLLINYLICLYSNSNSEAWIALTKQLELLFSSNDDDKEYRQIVKLINHNRKKVNKGKTIEVLNEIRKYCDELIDVVGNSAIISLSPDYESSQRLDQIYGDIFLKINQSLTSINNISEALNNIITQNSIRILTMHKSKGLEFKCVIIQGVEKELFFNKNEKDNCCVFFVGVSRAKDNLILTNTKYRSRPNNANKNWSENRTPQLQFLTYADIR
ncbi:ATP-dependent helicase [Moraxella osloensis]|mgnify:CR=1 FL=1|uniref:ATP-dependent helicase n=2 Tax=Gammaproteobacteria TaxID=1236 RepID=UPI002005C5F7|nr:ATP-dependent helicase [Moraxella osloensis]MCK6053604.1 ATP-dependent helicase [Moraxella osloensis]